MPSKIYYWKNPNKYRNYSKKYHWDNREKCLVDMKKRYKDNSEERIKYVKVWRKTNMDKVRINNLNTVRRKIGFTPELFKFIFNSQNGKCAICNIILGKGMNLTAACADHCHERNIPRGILCKKCNLLLGHSNDNIKILKSAIEYLEKWI